MPLVPTGSVLYSATAATNTRIAARSAVRTAHLASIQSTFIRAISSVPQSLRVCRRITTMVAAAVVGPTFAAAGGVSDRKGKKASGGKRKKAAAADGGCEDAEEEMSEGEGEE